MRNEVHLQNLSHKVSIFIIALADKTEMENEFRLKKALDGLKINHSKININTLDEIKERINHHKQTLEEYRVMLQQTNISDEDPEDLFNYRNKYDSMLDEILTSFEEKEQEISNIELFKKRVEEIINDEKQ